MGGSHDRTIKRIRIALGIALAGAVLFAPWWGVVALCIVLAIFFRAYEIIPAGIAMDVLYGAPVPVLFDIPLAYTATFTALFCLAYVIKQNLFLST